MRTVTGQMIQREAAVLVVGELLDRLERVQDDAEAMLDRIRSRMTNDEIREFGFRLCGITAEPGIRMIHEAYQCEPI